MNRILLSFNQHPPNAKASVIEASRCYRPSVSISDATKWNPGIDASENPDYVNFIRATCFSQAWRLERPYAAGLEMVQVGKKHLWPNLKGTYLPGYSPRAIPVPQAIQELTHSYTDRAYKLS